MSARFQRSIHPARAIALGVVLTAIGACEKPKTAEDQPTAAAATTPQRVASVEGFETPESVRYDPTADIFFVSNIVGNPGAKDGAGYISRVGADGVVQAPKFIESGKRGVVLNAPKGMAISGDTLWVTDIDVVRAFDRNTGRPLAVIDLRPGGAGFLNDIAIGADGAKYVTDTGIAFAADGTMSHPGKDRIFRVEGNAVTVAAEGDSLGLPNGITPDPKGGFLLAPNGAKAVQHWSGVGAVPEAVAQGPGSYDGIEILPDGRVLVTSWADSTVYEVGDSTMHPLIRGVASPADPGVDTRRNHLAIPLFTENRVEIWSIPEKK
jgi:sugar lactone lactonase YvrE